MSNWSTRMRPVDDEQIGKEVFTRLQRDGARLANYLCIKLLARYVEAPGQKPNPARIDQNRLFALKLFSKMSFVPIV